MIRIKVEIKNDNFNKAMAQYRKLWRESGIMEELRERKHYKNKSTIKNEKKSKQSKP